MKDAAKKTLGICIPTFRRPHLLVRCLESAIQQSAGLPLRIFVADDSCSDVNRDVVAAASSRFGELYYARNPTNLGINENIRRVVELANTDYVWLIGEDDYFLPGALAKVCAEIQQAGYPFLFCNYAFVGDSTQSIGRHALSLPADLALEAADFIGQYLWSAGFMGACVLDLAAWRRVASDRYHGTYYAHVGHIVEMIGGPARSVRVLADALVANRAGERTFFTWRSDALGVYFGFERMCRLAADAVPALAPSLHRAVLVYREKQGYLSVRNLARMRAEGIFDSSIYQRHLRAADLPVVTRLVALSILVVPRKFFELLLAFKRVVRRSSGEG